MEKTAELMKRKEVNIAEAAFQWENCFIRADIIEKKGNQINLIEVKAKSWDPSESFVTKRDHNKVDAGILEYVYDVAFQKYVIQQALGPGVTVKAFLMMPDKSIVSDTDGINQYFRVVKDKGRVSIVREKGAEVLRTFTHVLTSFDVDNLCDRIISDRTTEQKELMGCPFTEFVNRMADIYVNHTREFCQVSDRCFKCPFYSNEKTPGMLDGKRECWEEKAGFKEEDFHRPSVGDLWCGLLGAKPLKKKLVENGKYFLSKVTADDIPPSKTASEGLPPSDRRLLQIALATCNDDIWTRSRLTCTTAFM